MNDDYKIVGGTMMFGSVVQYFTDRADIDTIDLALLVVIARYTVAYRRQYAYISRAEFIKYASKNIINKRIKRLQDLKLIDAVITKSYTKYELLEPKDKLAHFLFTKKPNKTKEDDVQF